MTKKWLLAIPVLLGAGYWIGPSPATPAYDKNMPQVPAAPTALVEYIKANEALHKLKPDNEARIIWANDTVKNKTPWSIVYLHGFSSSQAEGDPVHKNIAAMFGCNLYLSRLAEHGIDTAEQLINLTADSYWESAKEALAIGRRLGKKVIVMGTSTGGTLALQLAATYPEEVAGLVLYSPNLAINDPNAWILNNPWGLQVARLVKGGKYNVPEDDRPIYKQYWNKPFRLEAAVALEEMLETSMIEETFRKVRQPVLLLYYYKDEQHQDPVVKVSAMKTMFSKLATADSLKREKALPNTGNHVITSPIKSKDVVSVENETTRFLTEVMHLPLKQ